MADATIPQLTGERVRLRALTEDDLPAIVEQSSDAEAIAWTTVPSPYGLDDARHYLGLAHSGWSTRKENLIWAIEEIGAEGGEPGLRYAGTIDLRPGSSSANAWELGFSLHPAARGRGLMSDAVRVACRWAFDEGAPSMYWYANRGNWASRRVAWACGFTMHGLMPAKIAARGGPADCWAGSLLPGQPMRASTPWYEPPVLDDETIRLRPLRDEDASAAEEVNDPAHWIPEGSSLTPERFPGFVMRRQEAAASGLGVSWCIADRARDRPLGEIGIFLRAAGTDAAELGYQILPSARGRGVASRAARLVVDYVTRSVADGGLGFRRLVAETAADNEASNAVLRRSSFEVYGREHAVDPLPDGSYGDGLHWERLT